MAIKMVREPSATPNINNIDDIVPMRYAYGNQDGYVISKGTEAAATVNGSSFTIGSGRIVVQGVECDIDANGITIVVDNIATKKYFSVYLKVNLGTNTVNIQSEDDTAAYPDIQRGDDLTHTSTGIANLLLYTFEAQNGVISNVQKKIQAIEYSGTALADYDILKGTVEERLTRLGFKQGSIELSSNVTATTNILTRQGNYVIGNLQISELNTEYLPMVQNAYNNKTYTIGQLDEQFRPKTTIRVPFSAPIGVQMNSSGTVHVHTTVYIYPSGNVELRIVTYANRTQSNAVSVKKFIGHEGTMPIILNFGYEANPL